MEQKQKTAPGGTDPGKLALGPDGSLAAVVERAEAAVKEQERLAAERAKAEEDAAHRARTRTQAPKPKAIYRTCSC